MIGFLSFYAQIMPLNDRELFLKPTNSMTYHSTYFSYGTIYTTLGTHIDSKRNRIFGSHKENAV